MATFAHIERCISLTDQDIGRAVQSRESTKELLEHLARVAKPNEGAPKILLVFARMASDACDWLDGELRVELVGDDEVCVIESTIALGGGLRERALPSLRVNVPLSEFVRAVDRVPHMIEPLCVKSRNGQRLVLVSMDERAGASVPPVAVAVAPEHLAPPAAPAPAKATSDLRAPPPLPPRPPRPERKGGA